MAGIEPYARSLSQSVGPVSRHMLARCLRLDPGSEVLTFAITNHHWFEWLDVDRDWFWAVTAPRDDCSSTYLACRKALCVAGTLSTRRLLGAIQRRPSADDNVLPLKVLDEYLSQHGGFQTADGAVNLAEDAAWDEVFQESELNVVRALVDLGSSSSASRITRRAVEYGTSHGRVEELLYRSPAIERRTRGVYALITEFNPLPKPPSVVEEKACAAGSYWGPVSLQTLVERLDSVASEDAVRAEISTSSALDWLNESEDWFWFSADESPMRQSTAFSCAKVLVVATSLTVAKLREALARDRSRRAAQVPADVLGEYLVQNPSFLVECDVVTLARMAPDGSMYVSKVERTLVDLMREIGPVCRRRDILLAGQMRGLKAEKVNDLLATSPLVTKQHRGLYSVVGDPVSASLLWDVVNGTGD